jgi:outer membrane protein TolC
MAQALDAAWTRSLESAEATGRQRQAQAEQRVADTWLAGAPTLELSQREGRGSAADGSRETEVGVALPLWRFGQRQQNAQTAQAESDWAAAAERAARLRLAAQLRDQAGRLRLAEADVQQAAQQRHLLAELSADVERRVKAGDLAPADAMAAKADMLSARALEREAQQSLATQRSAWALLTGSSVLPEPESLAAAAAGEASLEQHAEAQLADAVVQRSRQRVAQVQAQRGAPPELGIGMRQERPGLGQPQQNSVALSLRVPFGTETHSQPRLAVALAEQDLALMSQQRLRLQLEAELALARSQLAGTSAQAEAEGERAALLRERAQLLKKSFQAGESSLPELLRAMAAAAQAESASARQRTALAQAQARLQQALGQLP